MRKVKLRDGTVVDVPNNAGVADIKRLAKQLVAQRRPAPVARARKPEPEILPPQRVQAPDYRAAEMAMMRQELAALREQNKAVISTLERIASKEAPDHGGHLERMNGTLERMAKPVPVPVDPTPALRELKAEFASGVDKIVAAVKAPISVVKDASGRPIGAKKD